MPNPNGIPNGPPPEGKWREALEGATEADWWTKGKPGKGRKRHEWEMASFRWPQKLYMKTPSAVQAVNQKFPIKKSIYDETGWDQFKNTLSKGWNDFRNWADKHLKPLSGLINLITGFVPLGGLIKTAIGEVTGAIDKVAGSNSGDKFNLYDFLLIYRNSIVALLFKLAIDYKVPVDTSAFKKLFHTTPEFKKYLQGAQGGEFAKTIVEAEQAAQKVITGNDQAKVPQTRKEAYNQTVQLVNQHKAQKGPDGFPMVTGEHASKLKNWLK
ncbi:MAG: hypothetical protein K2K53_06495 [Oscillospiraceae bacterium]|nr:hypothetical protein [Oscillospiraceae bacterium]